MKTLNTLAHKLTPEQLDELGSEVIDLEKIAPQLKNFLLNTPGDESKLSSAASDLLDLIEKEEFERVLLPCGSPKFSWLLSQQWSSRNIKAKALFAHSVKVSREIPKEAFIEKEGKTYEKVIQVQKISVFQHEFFF